MTSGTLVMLHGMTGTSEKMQPLAKSLAPIGWDVLCPQAEIEHPTRGGYAWWLRAEDPTLPLGKESQKQVLDSMQRVIRDIPDEPVIIGGFSQMIVNKYASGLTSIRVGSFALLDLIDHDTKQTL